MKKNDMEELILTFLGIVILLLALLIIQDKSYGKNQIDQSSLQPILDNLKTIEINSVTANKVLETTSQKVDTSTQDLAVLKGDMVSVREFTDKLDKNPNFKGTVGEEVVKSLLQQIPQDYVHYQYDKPDIEGKPDSVIELPNVKEKLIIDSKFVAPNENERIDKKTLDRAKEIKKYITPNVTLEFVIMWIPEQVYFELKQETHVKLTDMNIVATTTGLLRPLIYLIQRFALHLRLNEKASEYADFRNLIYSTMGKSNEDLNKGLRQLENGLINIKKGKDKLDKIKEIEE